MTYIGRNSPNTIAIGRKDRPSRRVLVPEDGRAQTRVIEDHCHEAGARGAENRKIRVYVSGAGVETTPETISYLDYLVVRLHAVCEGSHDRQRFGVGHVLRMSEPHQLVNEVKSFDSGIGLVLCIILWIHGSAMGR